MRWSSSSMSALPSRRVASAASMDERADSSRAGELRLRGAGACVRRLHDGRVHVQAEQLGQHLVALPRLAREEEVELPLRQQHGADEPLVVQAQEAADLLVHGAGAVLDSLPLLLRLLKAEELHVGGALAGRGADHAVAVAVDGELESGLELLRAERDQAAHLVAQAGDAAVEGVGHPVHDGALAGAGGPSYREQVQPFERDLSGLLVAGEPLQAEAKGAHGRPPPGVRGLGLGTRTGGWSPPTSAARVWSSSSVPSRSRRRRPALSGTVST